MIENIMNVSLMVFHVNSSWMTWFQNEMMMIVTPILIDLFWWVLLEFEHSKYRNGKWMQIPSASLNDFISACFAIFGFDLLVKHAWLALNFYGTRNLTWSARFVLFPTLTTKPNCTTSHLCTQWLLFRLPSILNGWWCIKR